VQQIITICYPGDVPHGSNIAYPSELSREKVVIKNSFDLVGSLFSQLAVDLLFILGEIIEVKGAFSHLTELHELEVQFPDISYAFLVIVDCKDKVPEVDNIVPELKLRRKATGIFQDPVGHPEVLRYPGFVVKAQGFSGIFEVVELPVRDRFPDPLLGYL